ncbi:hypothetical protein BHE74_00057015 [Ensete ventricosum]|nr:hypothetical protein BHE74_00057015 [Ensete ventricosum]RZS27547.1 hypothetical protein BHM03_00061039 [Ensete ventricosum]
MIVWALYVLPSQQERVEAKVKLMKLIPRFRVMELLKSKGLWTAKCILISLAALPDKKVMEKFVMPYKEKVPELLEILGLADEKGS